MRIIVVEDEPLLAKYVKKALEQAGYAVDKAGTAQEAKRLLRINDYDCMILDLNLPDQDGLQILKDEANRPPTLIASARDSQESVIEGFKAGTDDYLTKPFDIQELTLRVGALIRRSVVGKNTKARIITIENLSFNCITKEVTLFNNPVSLNNKELGILEYLLLHKGEAISQETLLEHVWDREIDAFTDTVRTNIKTLRKKIDPEKNIIKNIRGRGYVIN